MSMNASNKCTIKYLPGKGATGMWHCISPDGKDMCAYTVKAWAVMYGESHGWIPEEDIKKE